MTDPLQRSRLSSIDWLRGLVMVLILGESLNTPSVKPWGNENPP